MFRDVTDGSDGVRDAVGLSQPNGGTLGSLNHNLESGGAAMIQTKTLTLPNYNWYKE